MNAPLGIINLGSTGKVEVAIRYFSNRKKVGKFIDGLHTGVAVGNSKQLAELLLSNHHNPRGRRVARTAVISVRTPPNATQLELEHIDLRLMQAFWDFQKLLKLPMLGWTHTNTATRHLHMIFPNSNGLRCLDLRPRWLRQLQGFAWTVALVSGRGKGRRKALAFYPRARKLAVRDLAVVLLHSNGQVRQDRWKKLVQSGKISNFRYRKNGDVISFEYVGRRMRLATLQHFLAAEKGDDNMTTVVDPNDPVPDGLMAELNDAGFTSEDVQEILRDIREARQHLALKPSIAEPKPIQGLDL